MGNGNQIWRPYLELLQQGMDTSKLHYKARNSRVSPYLELQGSSLYENGYSDGGDPAADVNPYVRFFSIFDPLLTPDDLGYEEFDEGLADVLLHYLADIDTKTGMCREDFYIECIIRDIERGIYGGLKEQAEFTKMEKREIARWLVSFYKTGDAVASLAGAAKSLLPGCMVSLRKGEEFVFYMQEMENRKDAAKLTFLLRLFMPLSCSYVVHWTKTYGVVGYDETMGMGNFILA